MMDMRGAQYHLLCYRSNPFTPHCLPMKTQPFGKKIVLFLLTNLKPAEGTVSHILTLYFLMG